MDNIENNEIIEQNEAVEEIKSYKIKILGKISYVLDDKGIEITTEDLNAIGKTKCFDVKNNRVIDYDNSSDLKNEEILEKINELKQLLSDSDYQAIKYAEGVISEEEYLPIRILRQSYRDEINQLEEELKHYID